MAMEATFNAKTKKLTLTLDIDVEGEDSDSGKSHVHFSSRGLATLEDTDGKAIKFNGKQAKIGLNITTPVKG